MRRLETRHQLALLAALLLPKVGSMTEEDYKRALKAARRLLILAGEEDDD